EQERVVPFERVEHLPKRARRRLDAPRLRGGELVQVLVDRLRRLDLSLDAVQTSYQHRRERQVGVRGRVRASELDALRLRALRVYRDADGGRAVALQVHQVDRRLVARHQAT